MRYRKMTADGDYLFGQGSTFLVDSKEAVEQALGTRLRLLVNEWFLDLREGVNLERILGYGTQATRDQEIQQRILDTQGVSEISFYASYVEGRKFIVYAEVLSIYGPITLREALL